MQHSHKRRITGYCVILLVKKRQDRYGPASFHPEVVYRLQMELPAQRANADEA